MKTKLSNSFLDGGKLKIGLVASRFHKDVTNGLLQGALKALKKCGVAERNITVVRVPGAFEIPFALQKLLKQKHFDALVACGAIVKGETKHDEYLASSATRAVLDLSLKYNTPIGLGIITALNLAQAKARSGDNGENRGEHAAHAAVEMALMKN